MFIFIRELHSYSYMFSSRKEKRKIGEPNKYIKRVQKVKLIQK